MRRAAAAALLAALAAAGCKPSSLTPGFIEERGPEATVTADVRNGLWAGPTSQGGAVEFQVGSGSVANFAILFIGSGPCAYGYRYTEAVFLIEGGTFSLDDSLEGGGLLSFQGTFVSPTECVGTYSYSGIPILGNCPRSGGGTFSATLF